MRHSGCITTIGAARADRSCSCRKKFYRQYCNFRDPFYVQGVQRSPTLKNMKATSYLLAAALPFLLFSCVSTKKLEAEQAKDAELSGNYLSIQQKYREAQDEIKRLQALLDKGNSEYSSLKSS